MKNIFKILFVLIIGLLACDEMDDNYDQYLDLNYVYPPKVQYLTANVGLKEATLYWESPTGNSAHHIFIDYGEDSLVFETMVDSAVLTDLEIKGYDVYVYVMDQYNNKSVPESITIFPNGENELEE